jgi:hypothetical protein
LSHWHWDRSGGITTVVAVIAAARDRAGRTPLHTWRGDQVGLEARRLRPDQAVDLLLGGS